MTTWITVFYIVLIGLCVLSIYRNLMVYRYRDRMRKWVFWMLDQTQQERAKLSNEQWRAEEKEFQHRLEVYTATTYDQMMYKFWKPLKSFYPEYEEWRKRQS